MSSGKCGERKAAICELDGCPIFGISAEIGQGSLPEEGDPNGADLCRSS
ncbi:MAG: hypothetical protein Q8P67_28205 [archaeon]|nr:hypothetical protein [archaeon]